MFPASSNGPSGSAAFFTLEKYFFTTLSAASAAFATAGSGFFQAFASQPIFKERDFRSMEGEYVRAALSRGNVLRSRGSWPAITANTCAASSADLANGPILSI